MQPLWYGDRRDRVKWGALSYLAERFDLSPIVQVAYCRDEDDRKLELRDGHRKIAIPKAVWNHFSDLRDIERLGRATGRRIVVIDESFQERQRREYVKHVIDKLKQHPRPMLLFLDPDTGIQPDERAGVKHATTTDVREFWGSLQHHEVLAVYQHATRRGGWLHEKLDQLRSACNGSRVSAIQSPRIAKDVAMLWTQKT